MGNSFASDACLGMRLSGRTVQLSSLDLVSVACNADFVLIYCHAGAKSNTNKCGQDVRGKKRGQVGLVGIFDVCLGVDYFSV